jgi:serine/threonine protein kinase
MLFNKF